MEFHIAANQVYFPVGFAASAVSINTRRTTWISFVQFRNDVPNPVYNNRENIFLYFQKACSNAVSITKHITESELTRKCLDPLVNFGHVVMEDCSSKISDFSQLQSDGQFAADPVGEGFCSGCFAQELESTSDCIEIIGRRPTSTDMGSLDPGNSVILTIGGRQYPFTVSAEGVHQHVPQVPPVPVLHLPPAPVPSPANVPVLPYQHHGQRHPPRLQNKLPSHRVSPLETVWVLKVKAKHVTLMERTGLDHVHELALKLEGLLRTTPDRNIAYGVITNLVSCVFVSVQSEIYDGVRSYQAYHSVLIVNTEAHPNMVANSLADFVSSDLASHGFPTELHISAHFAPERVLGRGSTGTAILGKFLGTDVVMKVSIDKDALQLERWILAYLLHQGVPQDMLPELHAEAQQALFDDLLQSCTLFRHRYERVVPAEITRADLMVIWGNLCSIHAEGIVHRDIRIPNIMRNPITNSVILIDYSAACTFPLPDDAATAGMNATILKLTQLESIEKFASYFEPRCVATSSDAVLGGEPTLPADEACSLIYVALQVCDEDSYLWGCGIDANLANKRALYLFIGWPVENIPPVRDALLNLERERLNCSVERRTQLLEQAFDAIFPSVV